MTVSSLIVVAAVAAASVAGTSDLCSTCACTIISISLNDEELSEIRDYRGDDVRGWSPILSVRDPAGKFLDVDCSNRRSGWKWPTIEISGACGSFERSDLESVPEFPDAVKNKMLKLSLGRNRILEITPGDFDGYQQLRELDLSRNRIRSVADESFLKIKKLAKLNLSGNQIAHFGKWFRDASLKYLDASDNRISEIEPEKLGGLRNLKLLNLSGNKLSTLPGNFGDLLSNLKFLYLMRNRFEQPPRLPKSLMLLDVSSNVLNALSFPQKDQLPVLDVSNNNLNGFDSIYKQTTLEVFRANHNHLSTFDKWNNHNLKVLDLAYNNFKVIPREINSENLPHLQELYLDGNPINELAGGRNVKAFTDLNVLGLSNLGNVEAVDQQSLIGIVMESYINCSEEKGLFIDLSKNKLTNIDLNTFKTFPICSIDLSGNRLTSIPETLLPWSDLTSVDLQNNPWNCVCALQWILNTYLPHFYKVRPETLFDLRCSSPSRFKNKMFVFWYNVTKNVFCMGESFYQYEYSSGKFIEIWTISLIISIVLGVLIVILMIAIAVLLFTRQRRIKAVKVQKTQKEKRSKPIFCELRTGGDIKYNEISQDAVF